METNMMGYIGVMENIGIMENKMETNTIIGVMDPQPWKQNL